MERIVAYKTSNGKIYESDSERDRAFDIWFEDKYRNKQILTLNT